MDEQPTYELTITVKITDPQALYRAAVQQSKREAPSYSDKDVTDTLGTAEEPDLGACLQTLGDPGCSWPGTEIQHSSAVEQGGMDYHLGNL